MLLFTVLSSSVILEKLDVHWKVHLNINVAQYQESCSRDMLQVQAGRTKLPSVHTQANLAGTDLWNVLQSEKPSMSSRKKNDVARKQHCTIIYMLSIYDSICQARFLLMFERPLVIFYALRTSRFFGFNIIAIIFHTPYQKVNTCLKYGTRIRFRFKFCVALRAKSQIPPIGTLHHLLPYQLHLAKACSFYICYVHSC